MFLRSFYSGFSFNLSPVCICWVSGCDCVSLLKPRIRELFLVCVGVLNSSTHPVYDTHTPFLNEKLLFSHPRAFHHGNIPNTSHLNILKMLIWPSTHQALATITLSASSKYSRAIMCHTVWFHSPLNIHIQFSTMVKRKSTFAPYVGHMTHTVCVWLHLSVVIDFKKRRKTLQQ